VAERRARGRSPGARRRGPVFVPPYVGIAGGWVFDWIKGCHGKPFPRCRESYEKVAPPVLYHGRGKTPPVKARRGNLSAERTGSDAIRTGQGASEKIIAARNACNFPNKEASQFGYPVGRPARGLCRARRDDRAFLPGLLGWRRAAATDSLSMRAFEFRRYLGHNGWIAWMPTHIAMPGEVACAGLTELPSISRCNDAAEPARPEPVRATAKRLSGKVRAFR